ncbi:M23 family metallopeptidase [Marininema halotolerans]|uniref:M23 family metallopeptidase n=1 Tax=Marininema halotolerans TaxID=1155944 RepID=UPI000B83C456
MASTTVYAHFSKIHGKPREKVVKGSIIGIMGKTEKVKAKFPNLHFEVRLSENGLPINPLTVLPAIE